MSGNSEPDEERLGRWVDALMERLENRPLLWIRGEEGERIECLRRWSKAVAGTGLGVRLLDGLDGERSLWERLPAVGEGGMLGLLIIDHWRPDQIAPEEVEDFHRWLGGFTGEGPATVALGVEKGRPFDEEEQELAPLPDWALEEIEVLDLEDLGGAEEASSPPPNSATEGDAAALFPALTGAGGPTRSAQFPVGPRNRPPEVDGASAGGASTTEVEELNIAEPEGSPVRELFDVLVEVHTLRGVELNLRHHEGFASMVGPLEARFCEWTYEQLERRTLAQDLLDYGLMSPATAWKLASRFGLNPDRLENLDRRQQVRRVLEAMGVREPSLPPTVRDGTKALRALHRAFERLEQGIAHTVEGERPNPEALIPAARRGAERLLKIIADFLWSAGLEEVFTDVCEQGLGGFHAGALRPESDSADWLLKGDLGTLNHLLRAVDTERRERGEELIFLRDREDYWGDAVFHPINQLATALSKEVHEGMAQEERRNHQRSAIRSVVRIIDGTSLRIPRAVQFFRQYRDDLGTHYEGWTLKRDHPGGAWQPERIRFYEVPTEMDLHRPYLYLAATNPSAVDARCAWLRDEFLSPP